MNLFKKPKANARIPEKLQPFTYNIANQTETYDLNANTALPYQPFSRYACDRV